MMVATVSKLMQFIVLGITIAITGRKTGATKRGDAFCCPS